MNPSKKRVGSTFSAGILSLVLLISLIVHLGAGALTANAQQPQVKISFSKDRYWYEPGSTVNLKVTMSNGSGDTLDDVSVRARIHRANSNRSELDSVLDGRPSRTYRLTTNLKTGVTLKPGSTSLKVELPLKNVRLANGVYPLTVEARQDGSTMASAYSQLIIMSVEGLGGFPSLRLSMIMDLLEPSHLRPQGGLADEVLASECKPGKTNPGWYATILDQANKWQNMAITFAMSPMLLAEMHGMADGYSVKIDGKKKDRAADSAEATGIASVLDGFTEIAREQRFQFLATPYASCNLETLSSLGWTSDSKKQITDGQRVLEKGLETTIGKEFYYPPGLKMNSTALGQLAGYMGNFIVLGPELLERSREGRKIAGGLSLGSPIEVKGNEDQHVLALFADERLESLMDRFENSKDAHVVAQAILSDITNLYLERPSMPRACLLVWPSWWRPTKEVVEETFRALAEAPWLQGKLLAEIFFTVPQLKNTVLEIPDAEPPAEDYFATVALARDSLEKYSEAVFEDNPNLARMNRNLFTSESDVWRQWDRPNEGLAYAQDIITTMNTELAKIEVPAEGTLTLTSSRADVPLTVLNGTGYKVKGKFRFSSNGLAFPEGSTVKVTLQPKENMFEIPVKVKKKGRVRLTAVLESGGRVIATVNINVLTSRFNTFAATVVGGILALIIAVWLLRISARRKAGKHKKGYLESAENEEPQA